MSKSEDVFDLGVVMVTVNTDDGESHVEDWAPEDAAKAKEYARETAHCGDVKSVDFENATTGEFVSFTNPAMIAA